MKSGPRRRIEESYPWEVIAAGDYGGLYVPRDYNDDSSGRKDASRSVYGGLDDSGVPEAKATASRRRRERR